MIIYKIAKEICNGMSHHSELGVPKNMVCGPLLMEDDHWRTDTALRGAGSLCGSPSEERFPHRRTWAMAGVSCLAIGDGYMGMIRLCMVLTIDVLAY